MHHVQTHILVHYSPWPILNSAKNRNSRTRTGQSFCRRATISSTHAKKLCGYTMRHELELLKRVPLAPSLRPCLFCFRWHQCRNRCLMFPWTPHSYQPAVEHGQPPQVVLACWLYTAHPQLDMQVGSRWQCYPASWCLASQFWKSQHDPELGLAGKFYLEEGKKTDKASPPGTSRPIPNTIHLVWCGDYLLSGRRWRWLPWTWRQSMTRVANIIWCINTYVMISNISPWTWRQSMTIVANIILCWCITYVIISIHRDYVCHTIKITRDSQITCDKSPVGNGWSEMNDPPAYESC